jgi:hypothetical protein
MPSQPNPYSDLLGSRDPQEVMASTPRRLEDLPALTGEKADLSYAPGKWTAAQILAHLADCEIAFGFRLRQAIAEKNHVIQPFDQDSWARATGSSDPVQSLAVFVNLRRWNLAFVKQQEASAFNRMVIHPQRGTMTFSTLVQTIAGHDLNHLAQLESIAGVR